MFTTLIEDLKQGNKPDLKALRQRLQLALIKKKAMMRLQPQFRHNDTKINPESRHMLWAALLVDDQESVTTLLDIMITEAYDCFEARRGAMGASTTPPSLEELLTDTLQRLLATATDPSTKSLLKEKIKKSPLFKELPGIFV